MDQVKNIIVPPTIKNNEKDIDRLKEFSVLNQAVYLFARQDKFMTAAQFGLDNAKTNQDLTGTILIKCLSAVEHAFLPTKYAMPERLDSGGGRRKCTKLLNDINQKLSEYLKKGSLTPSEYTEIHGMLMEAIDSIYEANQNTNLGVPMDFKRDQAQKIREAFR